MPSSGGKHGKGRSTGHESKARGETRTAGDTDVVFTWRDGIDEDETIEGVIAVVAAIAVVSVMFRDCETGVIHHSVAWWWTSRDARRVVETWLLSHRLTATTIQAATSKNPREKQSKRRQECGFLIILVFSLQLPNCHGLEALDSDGRHQNKKRFVKIPPDVCLLSVREESIYLPQANTTSRTLLSHSKNNSYFEVPSHLRDFLQLEGQTEQSNILRPRWLETAKSHIDGECMRRFVSEAVENCDVSTSNI